MRFLAGISVVVLIFIAVGAARAQGEAVETQYGEITAVESQLEEQDEVLERGIEEISDLGSELEESQALVDGARSRSEELEAEAESLRRDARWNRAAYERAKDRHEQSAREAYKGGGLKGMDFLLDSLLDSGGSGVLTDPAVVGALFGGRDALERYQASEQVLRDTIRQVSEKEQAYDQAVKEEGGRAEELRRKEEELEGIIAELRVERDRSFDQLQELRARERARILRTDPATGGTADQKNYELRIAREEIVAEEVEPIPKKRYIRLYKQSAKKYGFAEDWRILAAVGKVESNHGENMGPSTAGAMGPMQFLPSTWLTSGVDGNGDGIANIMDPEDAIPAAAKYLKTGGAPEDWYAALYSYNHADWYVKKVLAVAQAYRQMPTKAG
ncbi:MAG: lytic murein transglycosylase [Rubrobacteraceae bacterium]